MANSQGRKPPEEHAVSASPEGAKATFAPTRASALDGVDSRGLRPWLPTVAPPGLKTRNFKTGAQG